MALYSKVYPRKRALLLAEIGVMVASQRKQTIKKKQLKRFWRRSIFRHRKLHSEYYTLYQQLRETDREFHYRYVRMSKERFDHLLEMISFSKAFLAALTFFFDVTDQFTS